MHIQGRENKIKKSGRETTHKRLLMLGTIRGVLEVEDGLSG